MLSNEGLRTETDLRPADDLAIFAGRVIDAIRILGQEEYFDY